MYRRTSFLLATAIGLCLAQPQILQLPRLPPGSELPGLTSAQLELFAAGKEDFEDLEKKEDGLGPTFNGISCHSCHNIPTTGGVGNVSVLRVGRRQNGVYTEPQGGSLLHLFATEPKCQPRMPQDANVLARRIPTPLFGLGLVEAIPDEMLRQLQAITGGRAALITDPATKLQRVGRFGWKAQQATLLSFAGDAYVNEMGITNDIFPTEGGTGLSAQTLSECSQLRASKTKLTPSRAVAASTTLRISCGYWPHPPEGLVRRMPAVAKRYLWRPAVPRATCSRCSPARAQFKRWTASQ